MITKAFSAIAFLAMALITVSFGALAEEAEEPQVEDIEELEPEKNVTFMFVQTAHSGTLVPVEGAENHYTLTLVGVAPQTIAFSDRPERIVVQVPMQQFLDGLCFSAENPPNAALDILDADEEEDVAVMELLDPVYDNNSQTLQYTVSILKEPNHSYAIFNERADQVLPETFGPATLFIDDCPDSHICCYTGSSANCGCINVGCCYKWYEANCDFCVSGKDLVDKCVRKYGEDCAVAHGSCSVW